MRTFSNYLVGLGIGAFIINIFWGLPLISGSLDSGAWSFIAALFALAAWANSVGNSK